MKRLIPVLRDADWLTTERLRLIAVAMLTGAVVLTSIDFWAHTRHGLTDGGGEKLGRDFVYFWGAARQVAAGHAAAVYDVEAFRAYLVSLTGPDAQFNWFGYPPMAMLLALPIAALPFKLGLAVWILAGLALLAWVLSRSLGWRWAAIAAVAAPPSFLNVIGGQNGAFSAVLMAGGVLLLKRRPLLAGVLFGLLTYKPHLGVLIPVALLAAGRWRTILAAAATVAALVLATGLAMGWDTWAAFLHIAPMDRQIIEVRADMWPRMPSIYVAARWLGAGALAAYACQGVVALATAATVFAVWRSAASQALKGVALLVGVFLVTPYAWDYDMVMLPVAAAWFW